MRSTTPSYSIPLEDFLREHRAINAEVPIFDVCMQRPGDPHGTHDKHFDEFAQRTMAAITSALKDNGASDESIEFAVKYIRFTFEAQIKYLRKQVLYWETLYAYHAEPQRLLTNLPLQTAWIGFANQLAPGEGEKSIDELRLLFPLKPVLVKRKGA